MKSVLKRIASLSLALVMILGLCTTTHAATGHFDDVSTSHWAYENIEKMAEGGLVSGYGNRKFGPQDQFTIAQMAQIVCNALGHEGETKNGYWAYGVLDYCLNGLECLPDFGEINRTNYDVPITRELTVYMLINGLGTKDLGEKVNSVASRLSDIPDWRDITYEYRDAVETAYREGMVNGIDDAGTFNPKGLLTRAEGVTMLVRAGYTTAPKKVTDNSSLRSNAEAYEIMKTMGKWKKVTDVNSPNRDQISFTDSRYEGISVGYTNEYKLYITLSEGLYFTYVEDGKLVVEDPKDYGEDHWFTGYSYEARRFVKELLTKAYGEEPANAIYDGLRSVFEGTAHVHGGGKPAELLVVGDRCVYISYNSDNKIVVISVFDDTSSFDGLMAHRESGWAKPMFLDWEYAKLKYELEKW